MKPGCLSLPTAHSARGLREVPGGMHSVFQACAVTGGECEGSRSAVLLGGMCTGTPIDGLHTVLGFFPGRGIFQERPLNSEPRCEPLALQWRYFPPCAYSLGVNMGDQQAASLESLIFVSNVYAPLPCQFCVFTEC